MAPPDIDAPQASISRGAGEDLWLASFIDQSNARSAFVDIENLLVMLLYVDTFHNWALTPRHRVPLRLVSYGRQPACPMASSGAGQRTAGASGI